MRLVGLILGIASLFLAARYSVLTYERPEVDRSSEAWTLRQDALARARVFLEDGNRRSRSRTARPSIDPLTCAYVPEPISGTTPKFDCRFADGEVVKVKYGDNPEIPAEIAATRLLTALGFAADHVWPVAELVCVGCPPHPFRTRQLAELLFLSGAYDRLIDASSRRVFRDVALERKFDAPAIEAGDATGWDWSELDRVDPSVGGASPADVDALRLVAVLLAHWDNKPSNQRLVCLDERPKNTERTPVESPPCQRLLLMLHDVGATFGPKKLDHANWSRTPIWAPGADCVATMSSLPYQGATFRPKPISTAGRLRLSRELTRLSETDMHRLFREAGFPDARTGTARAADVSPWVDTLQHKINQIVEPPCTSLP